MQDNYILWICKQLASVVSCYDAICGVKKVLIRQCLLAVTDNRSSHLSAGLV
jgi:hypothetical protein